MTKDTARGLTTALVAMLGVIVPACGGFTTIRPEHYALSPATRPLGGGVDSLSVEILADGVAYKPDPIEVRSVLQQALAESGQLTSSGNAGRIVLEVSLFQTQAFLGSAFDPLRYSVRSVATAREPGADLPFWGRVYASDRPIKGSTQETKALVGALFQKTLQLLVDELQTQELAQARANAAPPVQEGDSVQGLEQFYAVAQRLFGFTASQLDVYAWNASVPERMLSYAIEYLPAATQVVTGGGPPAWAFSNTPLYAAVSVVPQLSPVFFYCGSPPPQLQLLITNRLVQGELREIASVDAGRATRWAVGIVAMDVIRARQRVGRLAFQYAEDGPVESEPIIPREVAEDPARVAEFMLTAGGASASATEILIDGFWFCLDMQGPQLSRAFIGSPGSGDRFDYKIRLRGRSNLQDFAELLTGPIGQRLAVDSLEMHASGSATPVDSTTVIAWLGQPLSRSPIQDDGSVWEYVNEVIGGQRHTAALVLRRGRLEKMEIEVAAGSL